MGLSTEIKNCKTMFDLQNIIMEKSGKIKVEAKISFWGKRYVQEIEHGRKFWIDDLASRVIYLVREKKFEFSQEERVVGKLVAKEITRIYAASDLQLKESNWFTWVVCFFREVWSSRYFFANNCPFYSLTRHEWNLDSNFEVYSDAFSHYTVKQFEETFGYPPSPEDLRHRPFEGGKYNPPQLVNESLDERNKSIAVRRLILESINIE